jgi:NO-binding membrane sensor protein with MHYT domain/anti-sigma regulatory factor (Ser/Thr protein kinase)
MTSPEMVLVGTYDYRLVVLSVLIAILASYAALDLAGRVTSAQGKARLLWLNGGAVAMGIGIWSMHYIGMLAFRLPIPVQYDWPRVSLSLVAAIVASGIALFVVSRHAMGVIRGVLGSIFMGSGIAVMHYTGMAAMRLSAMCSYSATLVTLSVILAIVISFVALWLTFYSREETTGWSWRKMHCALVMGAAIPVMHYTGMAAASFTASPSIHGNRSHAISVSSLSVAGVTIVPLTVLGIALLTSLAHRQFSLQTLELQLKDEFVSHVSHELRSPLTAIYQFATILADGLAGELRPKQSEYMGIILRNVRQLESRIADLLEVTRIQAGKLNIEPQGASLRDAITDTVSMFEGSVAAKGITLRTNIPADLPLAYVDPSRVRQVLINLVSNAIKFTAKGGEIKLQTRIFEEDPGLLVVEIADSGCGIKPEVSKLIFERLHQASDAGEEGRKGLGLGLYISKELVARQGGKIWVTSEPHKGSNFFFTVPIFSLASLISPILTNEVKLGDGIAVLVVEMDPRDASLSPNVRVEMSNVARTLLQRCSLPDLDVVLPKMDLGDAQELFFAVACANKHGAEVMSRRVREQFRRCERLQKAGLIFTVSYSFLPPISRSVSEPMGEFAEHVAAGVQEHINTMMMARSVPT